MGWRRPEALKVPLARPLAKQGRPLRPRARDGTSTRRADRDHRRAARRFGYDHLVLATGADLDWSNVARLRPRRGPRPHLLHRRAGRRRRARRSARFVASDGGRAIIGANPGASCGGPAYEIIMMLETAAAPAEAASPLRPAPRDARALPRPLRRQRHRQPEPHDGGRVPLAAPELDDRTPRSPRIEPGKATLADGTEMPFDLAVLIPAFYGAQVVRDVDGLGNPRGFIPADRHLRSTRFPQHLRRRRLGGDRAARRRPPCPSACRRPATCPRRWRRGRRPTSPPRSPAPASCVDGLTLPSTCVSDAGDVAFYIHADPFLPPRNVRHAAARRPLPLPEARLRALLPREDEARPAVDALRLVSRPGSGEIDDARPDLPRLQREHADRARRCGRRCCPSSPSTTATRRAGTGRARRRRRPSRAPATRSPRLLGCSPARGRLHERRHRGEQHGAQGRRRGRRRGAAAHRDHARSSTPRSSSPAATWSGTAST